MRFVLSGGPLDGHAGEFDRDALDLFDGPPREMPATRGGAPLLLNEPVGTYVASRKITREGRLIYEWRPAPPWPPGR